MRKIGRLPYMKKVIFIGNGINRISNNLSWNNLLIELQQEDLQGLKVNPEPLPNSLPSTLKYEFILLSSYIRRKFNINDEKENDRQLKLKESIAQKMSFFIGNEIYDRLVDIPSVQFITTNYDHVLDKTLIDKGFKFVERNSSETLYNIRRFRSYEKEDSLTKIFPIHGDIDAPKSITIDYNHYCGTVAKIDSYLKGSYEWEKGVKIVPIDKRIKNNDNYIYSWIDHFFFSDIHIIGFSLEWVEIELWWLLDKRRRYQRTGLAIDNRIIFYFTQSYDKIDADKGSEDYAKYMMLEKLGVQCRFLDFEPNNTRDYLQAYHVFLDSIQERFGQET